MHKIQHGLIELEHIYQKENNNHKTFLWILFFVLLFFGAIFYEIKLETRDIELRNLLVQSQVKCDSDKIAIQRMVEQSKKN